MANTAKSNRMPALWFYICAPSLLKTVGLPHPPSVKRTRGRDAQMAKWLAGEQKFFRGAHHVPTLIKISTPVIA
jgi:hypothetical protein